MRLSAIWSEAWRNTSTGTSRLVIASLVLGVVLAVLALSDVRAIVSLVQQAESFRESGAAISTLSTDRRIDGGACEALGSLPGVSQVGAARRAPTDVVVSSMPRSPVPTYEVTPGFARLLAADSPDVSTGVVLSESVAVMLGLGVDDLLVTTSGSAAVRAIYPFPDDGRRSGLGFAVLVLGDDAPYEECWLSRWPQSADTGTLLFTTLTSQVDDPATGASMPVLSQLNTRLGESLDGAALFEGRPTRMVPWAALGAGAVLGWVLVSLRRLELASARHSGVSGRAQMLQVLVEVVGIALASVVLAAVPSVVAVAAAPVDDVWPLGASALRAAALGSVGLVLGAAVGVALVHERRLFRYFADR